MDSNIHELIEYASIKHKGQKRKGGIPYITHPLTVALMLMNRGYSMRHARIAIAHDLLEDTNATPEELSQYLSGRELMAVKCLTKKEGQSQEEYMTELSFPESKIVKLVDRLHNLKSAFNTNADFIKRYIKETEDYYYDLAKGTEFFEELVCAVQDLKKYLENT